MSFDQLVQEIGRLTASQRANLVDLPVEGMSREIDPGTERSQLDEISPRRSTPAELIPAEDVFRDVENLLDE